MARSRPTAGFTLIELLVGLAVAAVGVAAAAAVTGWGMKESGRGHQATELQSRMKIVSKQISTDIEAAGMGSSGAVGVEGVVPISAFFTTGDNKRAAAVVRGANGPGGAWAGGTLLSDTDVLQVIVGDPTTRVQPIANIPRNATNLLAYLPIGAQLPCQPSNMLYISDHSLPNGAGRTQLVCQNGGGAVTLMGSGTRTGVMAGADIMCARATTYWVDNLFNLHRTDSTCGGGASAVGGLVANVGNDAIMSPGIEDFQVGYGVNSQYPGATLAGRWFWDGSGGVGPPAGPDEWLEVRAVRFAILMRSLRTVKGAGTLLLQDPIFDGAPKQVSTLHSKYVSEGDATIVNARYFDRNVNNTVDVEPY